MLRQLAYRLYYLLLLWSSIDWNELSANLDFFKLCCEVCSINKEAPLMKSSKEGFQSFSLMKSGSFPLIKQVEKGFCSKVVPCKTLVDWIS